MKSQPKPKRPTCPTCSKPLTTCLCSRIKCPSLDNKIHVTILQHSLETNHPLNSVRIIKLGLKNVAIVTVCDVNFEAQFEIHPLESGTLLGLVQESGQDAGCNLDVCGNVCESSGSDLISEVDSGRTTDLCFDDLRHGLKRKLDCDEILDCCVEKNEENSSPDGVPSGIIDRVVDHHQLLLTINIKKYGEITSLDCPPGMKQTENNITKLEDFRDSPLVLEAVAEGFNVKKLQKLPDSVDTTEFEIAIPSGSALLFPSQDSVTMENVDFEVKNLIVLDGTWAKANRIYNENPWLKMLPCVRLDIGKMSLFSEVRVQPRPGYLSTLESIVYALEALGEKDSFRGLDNLLEVFESMVGDQRRFKDDSIRKASLP